MIKYVLEVVQTTREKSLVVRTVDSSRLVPNAYEIGYRFIVTVPVEMSRDYQTLRRNISRAKEEGLMKVRAYQSNKIK